MTRSARERILVALDTPDLDRAEDLVRQLGEHVGGFKVGLELASSGGLALISRIRDKGADVFLDLKLHDIPNTVAGAAGAAARAGVRYLTVHALGGPKMIRRGVDAAVAAAGEAGFPAPSVLAVTVLTSHDDAELAGIGVSGNSGEAVLRLARLARDAGAGGVVCSPLEVAAVREAFPQGLLVVPGIRPGNVDVRGDDQARAATPADAVAGGADLLVIGRPITQAGDPAAAAAAIVEELARAL